MEVDVAVRQKQSRADLHDVVGVGDEGAAGGVEDGVGVNLDGALLVGGRNLRQFIHCAVNVGVNIRSS